MSQDTTLNPRGEGDFYTQGRDWEANRELARDRSERRAWIVAGVASFIAIVAVIGIAMLAPFRQMVPYVVAMDHTTGNVEVVNAVNDRTVGYQELNDKHWAQKYVVSRESYLWTLLQYDYDSILRLSDDPVGRDYAKLYDGTDARDKKYGSNIEMRVKVLSITLPPDEKGKAVVRFEKTIKRVDADTLEPPQTFVATLAYTYKPSMFGKEKDLIENPMGFKVTSYRVDSELSTSTPQKPAQIELSRPVKAQAAMLTVPPLLPSQGTTR